MITHTIRRDAWNARSILKENDWVVEKTTKLPVGVQPQITVEELIMAEETIRADERVRKLAADVGAHFKRWLLVVNCLPKDCTGITPENLYADGWSIGFDDRFPESTRLQQCLLFARFGEDENIYAHPMVGLLTRNPY